MEIPRVWKYSGDQESLHFMVTDGTDQRRIWLKRSQNAALYDFLVAHVAAPPDDNPESN
jgi:hypothetical protein